MCYFTAQDIFGGVYDLALGNVAEKDSGQYDCHHQQEDGGGVKTIKTETTVLTVEGIFRDIYFFYKIFLFFL